MHWHDMDGVDWVWMVGMMLLFWGGLAVIVVLAIRAIGPSSERPGPRSTTEPEAEELLRRRLARGEIDVEEYRRVRAELRGRTGDGPV